MIEAHGCKFSVFACQLCEYCSKYRQKLQRHVKIAHKTEIAYEDVVCEYEHEDKKKSPTMVKKLQGKLSGRPLGKLMVKFGKTSAANGGGNVVTKQGKQKSGSGTGPGPSDHLSSVMEKIVDDNGDKTFKCRECPFVNTDMQKVAKHMASWHVDIKHFNCTKCGYICFEKNEFLTHRLSHRNEHQYRCEECTYSTDFRPNFERHQINHKGVYPYKCTFCSYGCGSEPAVRRHMAVNHENLHRQDKPKTKPAGPELIPMDQDSYDTDPSQLSADGKSDNVADHSGAVKPSSTKSFYGSSRKTLPAPSARAKSLSPVRKLPANLTGYVRQKGGRLVCPVCNQKGYSRCSDLNRHMKGKHGFKLRDYLESIDELPDINGGDNTESFATGTDDDEQYDNDTTMECDNDVVHDEGDKGNIDDKGTNTIVTEDKEKVNTDTTDDEENVGNKLLKCKYCDFTNKFPSKIKRHMSVHGLEKLYKCSFCPRSFENMTDVKVHMSRVHHKVSNKVKVTKASVPAVKKTPTLPKVPTVPVYSCPQCPFTSEQKNEVSRHARVHTNKRFQCSVCEYQSFWKRDVKRHINKLHQEQLDPGVEAEKLIVTKPAPGGAAGASLDPVQLDIVSVNDAGSCNSDQQARNTSPAKGTSSHESSPDISLAEFLHRERSMTPSPVRELPNGTYKCQFCGYLSSAPSKMNSHIETHTNLKRYKCPLCGKRSNWKWDISKHLKGYHNDDVTEVVTLSRDEAERTVQAYIDANPYAQREHHLNIPDLTYYKCSKCSYTSEKRALVSRHISGVHGQANVVAVRVDNRATPISVSSGKGEKSKSLSTPTSSNVEEETPSGNSKQFMCSECGKRCVTKADVKRHFHFAHPSKEIRIFYLGDGLQSGNASKCEDVKPSIVPSKHVSGDLSDQTSVQTTPASTDKTSSLHNPKEMGYIKPFKCGHCGRRSNWRWDTLKHIRERHPGQELKIIQLSEHEARNSFHSYMKQELPLLNRISGSASRQFTSVKDILVEMTHEAETSDKTQDGQSKRFKCSACAYRSRLKTDCKRHILRRHGARAKVLHLSADEARVTSKLYTTHKQEIGVDGVEAVGTQMEMEVTPADGAELAGEVTAAGIPAAVTSPVGTAAMEKKQQVETVNDIGLPQLSENSPSAGKHKLVGWKRWKCTMCTQLFDEKEDALKHLEIHKMKAYKCTGCLWTSNFRSAVRKHVKSKHPEGIATCKVSVKLWRFKQSVEGFKAQTPEKKQLLELQQIEQMEEKLKEKEQIVIKEKVEGKDDLLAVYCCKLCVFRSRWRSCVCRHLKSTHDLTDYSQNMVKKIYRLNSSKGQEILAMAKKPNSKVTTTIPPRPPAPAGSKTDSPNKSFERPRNFACTICPYKAYKRKMLKFHMTCHKPQPGVKQVKCKYCPYYVNGARLLTQHMNLHLQDIKVRETPSPIIGLTTPTKEFLHPATSPVSNKRHKCEKCPYTSNSKNDYLYHKQFHRPKPTAEFKCDYCEYWVTHRRLIKQHMKVHQEADDVFVRPSPVATPTKSEYSENSLIYDTVEIAAIKQRIIASKITSSISQTPVMSPLKIASSCVFGGKRGYMRKDGTYRKIHRCRHCPYMNIRLRNMKLHELMHGKRTATHPLMKCPHCDYFVGSKGLLAHHLKVHQPDYGSEFVVDNKTDDSVSEDSEVDTNSIPVQSKVDTLLEIARFKKYGCEKCPYASSKRGRFQRHAELHGSRQKYKCDYCDYSVPTTILLRQHERLHYEPNQNLLAAQSILNLQYLPEMPADVALASMLTHNNDKHPVSVTHDHIDLYENTTEDLEPKKIYRCDRCPYANIRRDHLLAHLRCHMIKNTFACPYCDYSVGKIHVLMQHVKVHFSPLPELSEWLNDNGDVERLKEVKEKDLREAIDLAKLFQKEPGRDNKADETGTLTNDADQDSKDKQVNGVADEKETNNVEDIGKKDLIKGDGKENGQEMTKVDDKPESVDAGRKMEVTESVDVKLDGTIVNGDKNNMETDGSEGDKKGNF